MSITHSGRHWRMAVLAAGLLPALAASASARGPVAQDSMPTVDRVLERYVDAVGGRAALARLRTRVVHGAFVEDLPSMGPATPVRFVASAQVPGKWLVEWRSAGRVDRIGSDGAIGWEARADSVRRRDEIMRWKEAFVFDPQGPLRLREHFHDLVVTGTVRIDGRAAYEVTTDRRDAHYALYFAVETGLLIRVGYYWDLADYREVDGVLVPFRIAQSRKGGSSTFVIDAVEHNAAIETARFAMPDAPRVP
jgi:hypothetical protein